MCENELSGDLRRDKTAPRRDTAIYGAGKRKKELRPVFLDEARSGQAVTTSEELYR